VAHTAAVFGRAVVMPNLRPPIRTVDDAVAYRKRILAARPASSSFEPLMTLYLTDLTSPDEIARAHAAGIVAVKLYPAGATTNSEAGVTSLERVGDVLGTMEELGLPLLVHGEVTDPEIDIFDRERAFIDTVLVPLRVRFPGLRLVLEHATTRDAVEFVRACPTGVGATITAHHLLMNRNALFSGGLRPHHYCLPVLKREAHRVALVEAATSGDRRFFLGTDSAPHGRTSKECARGCAGIFTAHGALPLYAEVFEEAGALARLEAFAAFHGADFYGLARNQTRVRLERKAWTVPARYRFGDGEVVPLRAGSTILWQMVGD
jgi:dihydroorotase